METIVKKLYEAMFLVDSTQASDWDAVVKTIETILARAEAEIVSIKNWAERKLAYEINKKTRGTYVLCFFRSDGEKIQNIEKDVQLSEPIMRVLILSTETRDEKDIEKDMLDTQEKKEKAAENLSTPKQAEQVGQPEQPAEPKAVDESGPEQPEEQKADQEAAEDLSTPQQTDQAGQPEQSDEPQAADESGPEQTETEKDTTEKDASD
ncbi:MAG: 30S ribosomal protein S6 [Planctomycetes bacterium]|nr:30S ribosomal protein S6 [Planctomycetota bacterium]